MLSPTAEDGEIEVRISTTFFLMLSHHIFSALVLGGIYFGTGNDATKPFMNFKFCIAVLVFFMYTHIMTQVLLFPTEVKLLQREYFNRWYGLKPYYMALTVSTLPTLILFGFAFLVVSYLLSAQPLDLVRFMKYCLICLLVGAVSEGYGLAIGSMFGVMIGGLVAFLIFYRMVAYLALRFRLTAEFSSKLRNVATKILRRKACIVAGPTQLPAHARFGSKIKKKKKDQDIPEMCAVHSYSNNHSTFSADPSYILSVLVAEWSVRLTTGLEDPGYILSVPVAEWSGRLTTGLEGPWLHPVCPCG
uniref:ABC-2 type transporter transmembrane domain-containing protein n=1 Tax=Timema shepardi TaxID=629360 RepID=A0A7R9B8J6_TIMSH|nr:unnamed protein product [Timema shepardi]